MDPTRVVIENWPSTNQLFEYIPLIIAVLAIAISLYSAYLSRKSFISSFRPYVWAVSSVFTDSERMVIAEPHVIRLFVKNSPAKILTKDVMVSLNDKVLFSHKDENKVQFPTDEIHEWSFVIGKSEFEGIMNRSDKDKTKLRRLVSIKYSSLDGDKSYSYELEQFFDISANQWRNLTEESD